MTDAAAPAANTAAVPPVLDPDRWERYEGLRETTLAVVTEPELNAGLRLVCDRLYTMALEYRSYWPVEPAGSFRHQAAAGLADLRHLQGFFAHMGQERTASVLSPGEEDLSHLCSRLSMGVRDLADLLEQALQADGSRGPVRQTAVPGSPDAPSRRGT